MPQVVRLPAHVREGEIRACWESKPEGADIYFTGGPAREIVMMALAAAPIELGDGGSGAVFDAFASRAVRHGVSLIDKLEAEGYDTRTIVFSIMRKDAPPAPVEQPTDLRGRLENLQSKIGELSTWLENGTDHKSVYLFDEAEMEKMIEIGKECEDAITSLLDDSPA